MVLWQSASVAFFAYLILVAILRPTPPPARARVVWSSSLGVVLVTISLAASLPPLLSQWIWPALVLLIGYWSSGLLFIEPRPSQEAALRWLDDRLAVHQLARRIPRAVVEVLEAAYTGVYLLIPVALLLHIELARAPDPDRFWAVILITDFVCFGVLPWIQTRPPRALEPGDPWESSIRRFNLRLLGATSIQVNTFPSGHAAEAFAAFLLVLVAPVWVVALMFLAAVAVSAGAVLGRYHYLADALAGWVVALVVFLLIY